jgi:hypothetical protein
MMLLSVLVHVTGAAPPVPVTVPVPPLPVTVPPPLLLELPAVEPEFAPPWPVF